MAPKTAVPLAKPHPATQPDDLVTFYFRRDRLQLILAGIQIMQRRDDLTGQFARKLARQSRQIRKYVEEFQEDSKALLEAHKERYPEDHELAGQPTPVYATQKNEKGEDVPSFKKDASGNDTAERQIVPDSFNLKDPKQYQKDVDELNAEVVAIECSCFRVTDPENKDQKYVPELARFKGVSGAAIEFVFDLEEDSDLTRPPKDWAEKHPSLELVSDARASDDGPAIEKEVEATAP